MTTKDNLAPLTGVFFVSLSAMLWGTVGVATQAIYQQSDLTAVSVGFYRLALAFPFACVLCWKVVGKKVFAVSRKSYLKMVLIGLMLAGYQVLYFAAVGSIGVALATLITLCTAPVVVALASVAFLREPLSRATLYALVCALSGTVLLVGFPEGSEARPDMLQGVLMSLGSAVGYATVALLGRSIAAECHPIHSTTISFGVGATMLLPLAFANFTTSQYSGETIGTLIYVGLVPTAVAYSLFFLGMRNVRASTASILTMIEPLTATILAWIIFKERLGLTGIAGAALLLFSLVILYRGVKR